MNNEATDEVWYKRAVDYHFNNPEAFVFSVPFDIGDKRPTVVTATHAIFKGKGTKKTPAAVVGVQIDYEHFRNKFMNITNKQVRFSIMLILKIGNFADLSHFSIFQFPKAKEPSF